PVRVANHCAKALCGWKRNQRRASCMTMRRTAGIAVLADPLLALDAATAERCAGETGETGDGPAVAEWPAQHLADQHGGSLQAEADDLGEMLDHPLGPVRVRRRCHP